jgi:hypothetical protein
LLPGKPIPWSGDVYHYERIDRLNEQSLRFPIGNDGLLENIATAIEQGLCTGVQLTRQSLGRSNRPYWITNASLAAETQSDIVRDRLGLRSVNQAGYRLVEINYSVAYLVSRNVQIKAPTVLDAWQDGIRRSWIFTKAAGDGQVPQPGRTIDLSKGSDGALGPPEAVHGQLFVAVGDGHQFNLRVLRPTTDAPLEISLVGLLRNNAV